MALLRSLLFPSLCPQTLTLTPFPSTKTPATATRRPRRRARAPLMATSRDATKLVTFLGKGGAGKTTAAVLAAKYYAREGMRTCLVVHSQDPTAEQLMGCNFGNSPTDCGNNLSAVKLETSKLLLEPLNRVKKVDARLNLTQGILEGVVGEELGVLPGMDSIFSALTLQKLVNFLPDRKDGASTEFDIIVYDGISAEETLRLVGATERVRWYLKYMRNLAEKTEIGRLTSPSMLKLAYDSARPNGRTSEGKTSTEIWNEIEQILGKASTSFTDSNKFRCYLVMDPKRSITITSALRYWGCAIQAGTQISGALGFAPQSSSISQEVAGKFTPLSVGTLPYLLIDSSLDWDAAISSLSQDTEDLLTTTHKCSHPSVTFDTSQKSVKLFMPGFDKSEIKLYQYRGGSELLVEAGDQRRIIKLPLGMQGKVSGAKFIDRNLVVKLR
ncbi:uncharacterized protein At1g26090, chloroplastic isoform X1 [Ananas comosus]|uniref:Uncharacterized protein At1g26090, chloroplastic isoform X1 n=1 Tax=Ananas comosus TaxID=4615 RepID=A0A6P5F122_ANACO|nr:uncharacterized protein At1g26090, chloroplastic isoform X1 [Ananas comosus]